VALTDADGNVVHGQNFDPLARRTNPETWTYDFVGFSQPDISSLNIPDPEIWFNRGYTGHEHLEEFALINMNNRMYDPQMGRMLAVDNFVSDPQSTQAYNRYTYAANNPLSYIDPDGEEIVAAAIAGAMIGAFIGAVTKGWSGGSPGDIMIGFAIGGGAGAASGAAGSAVSGAIGVGTTAGSGIAATIAGGATSGFVNGAIHSAFGGDNILLGGLKGSLAGLAGGTVSGAIGGGVGAFLGGAASGAVSSGLNGGDARSVGTSAIMGGVLSYASFEIQMGAAYSNYNGSMGDNLTYGGFRKISVAVQRSFNWDIEADGKIMNDGSVGKIAFGGRATVNEAEAWNSNVYMSFHTHTRTHFSNLSRHDIDIDEFFVISKDGVHENNFRYKQLYDTPAETTFTSPVEKYFFQNRLIPAITNHYCPIKPFTDRKKSFSA